LCRHQRQCTAWVMPASSLMLRREKTPSFSFSRCSWRCLPRQARDTMSRTTHPIRVFLHIICVSQSVNGRSVYRESMSYAFHMHNATGSVNEECIASKAGADDLAWMCMFADCEPPSLSHNIIITACIRCSLPDTVLTDTSRCCVRCRVRCRVLCCVLALQTPCLTSTLHSS
jgi:hypothetical protein